MAEKSKSKDWGSNAETLTNMSDILWADHWVFSVWRETNRTSKNIWLCIGGITNRYNRHLHKVGSRVWGADWDGR